MSSDAIAHVFRHSTAQDKTFAVHLAIADSVNDQNENEFWMRLAALAIKARTHRSTTQRAVAWLTENGWIELVDEGVDDPWKAGRPVRYVFVFRDGLDVVYEGRGSRTMRDLGQAPRATGSRTMRDPGTAAPLLTETQGKPKGTSDVSDAERLANLLADLIEKNGSRRPHVTARWITEIDRMIRIDERSPEMIEKAIRWCQQDPFWLSNIMSPLKLRQQFDRIRLQSIERKRTRQTNSPAAMGGMLDLVKQERGA